MNAKLLNTKEVRKLGMEFAGRAARYTDKTKEDKLNTRRSVVWCFIDSREADALVAHFKREGVINEITRTGTMADMWKRTGGIEYVRVKAQMA